MTKTDWKILDTVVYDSNGTEKTKWYVNGWDAGCREEGRATAHLIAAAPDILEALKDLCEVAEFKGINVWDIAKFTKARAAISKAQGQKSQERINQ